MLKLRRAENNPILEPVPEHWWESRYVYNAGAIEHDGKIHILYRGEGVEPRPGGQVAAGASAAGHIGRRAAN